MAINVPEFDTEEDDDPIVARISQQRQQKQIALSGRLSQVVDTNADQFAETKRTAKYLNAPPAAVEALPDLAQQAKVQRIRETTAQSPILQQKIADDEVFAKLAHDDTQSLSGVERTIRVVKNLGRSVQAALPQFNEGIYGAAQAVTELGQTVLDPFVGTVLPENPFGRMAAATTARRQKEKLIRDTLEKARGTNGATEDAIYSGVQSGANTLLNLPLAILSRDPRALIGMGAAQTGGQAYGQARDEGKSSMAALPFAVSQATVEYATEKIPGIKLLEGLNTKQPLLKLTRDFLAREIPGEQAATALQDLNEWATLNPEKPFTEYLKERPGAAYSTLVATVVGGSMQAGAGKAIDYAVRRFVPQQLAADAAEQNMQALTQMDQLAAESKLRVRDPESFQQFIASAVEDGPVSDVYIDPQTLIDSGKLDALAQVSPAIRSQVEEAITTGSSIRIPFDDYATNIAGTELNQGLIENLRLDPEGMTFAQSEQYRQAYSDDFNKQVGQNIAQQGTEDAYQQSTESIKTLIKNQLNAAGHTSPGVNDTYATMASAYYTVRAAQLGITPQEMFDRNPLTITGQSLAGQVFNQADIGESLGNRIRTDFDAAVQEYSNLPGTDGGRILNTDEARELSPEYRDDRTRSNEVHEPASKFVKDLYAQKLAAPVSEGRTPLVLFTAGGTGAGKSSSLKGAAGQALQNAADIIYDTNMNKLESAVQKIEQALASGRSVSIVYTYRDPVEALVAGALPRAMRMGRTVPLNAHAETHIGVSKVIRQLQQKYANDPRVYIMVVDNSRGLNKSEVVNLDDLPTVEDNQLEVKLNEALKSEYQAGRISEAVYNGTRETYSPDGRGSSQALPSNRRGNGSESQPQRGGQQQSSGQQPLNQSARGEYQPATNTISLLKNADLSTFLHELGHSFLAVDTDLATEILNSDVSTEGRQQILDDADTLMKWFGIEGQDLKTKLTKWQALGMNGQRPYHEKFAEGFEAYLFEGKAPRLDMQPIFQRFRAWLANVYRGLQSYLQNAGETLTPEVRNVMDRMLANTDEIRIAQQARGMNPLFATAEEAEMTPEAFDEYQRETVQGSLDAIAAFEARSLRDMTWTSRLKEKTVQRLNKQAASLRKEMRKQVEADIDQEPIYAAMRFLKRGEVVDTSGNEIKAQEGHRLSIPDLEKLYPPGELSNHPDWRKLGYGAYGMLSSEGLHPDLVAEMFGFASGDDLVRTLLSAEPRNEVIEAVTDQRMMEQHGELSNPQAISRAADEAIHNDVRTRIIATELAGLQKMTGSALVLSRMAKDYARQRVGQTPVKDLRPNKFATDAARAGRKADEALRKGDREQAAIEKRNQLVNHASTKEAYEAQAEGRQILQRFRKIAGTKVDSLKDTHNMDLVNATRAILAEYGVGTRGQSPRDYMDLIKAYDPELFAALEPELVQAQQQARDLNTLTMDDLRALRDQVESLWYLARRERQMEVDGKMVDRDQIVKELSDRLDDLGMPASVPGETNALTEAQKRGRYLRGLRAALRRVESWVDRMDSGKISGKFRSFIFTPVSEAADRYRVDSVKAIKQFRDLLKTIEPSLTPGRITAPELNYTFGYSKGDAGMSELLHAIAHTGNESNKRKLLLGRNWATELEDGTLDTSRWDSFVNRLIDEGRLTKQHFDFVQGVWDLLEDTKPIAQKTHREVFGRYFAEVTANEFTNQFGTYRGGYLPAITDTFEVQDAAINAALEDVNQSNAYMFPSTSRGFTKSRVEYNRPLALDLRLIPQHIDKVMMFAHMERHVRDVQRVLKGMSGKLNRYDPVAYTDLLLPWLNRAAKQTVETPIPGWAGKASRIFGVIRSRAGMATMFANLTNALQQITGFSITLLKVKPVYLRQALAQYVRSPSGMAEAAAALSPFMAERLEAQSFRLRGEIEDLLLNPSKYEKASNWTQQHAYILQSTFQNLVDSITWTAAYNQALAEGAEETEAIRSGNAAVRETQGSLNPEDVSRFETGTAFTRMFTQFASYFNMQANVLGTEFAKVSQEMGLRKGAGRAFYVFLFGFLVPAWVSEAIVQGMRGGAGDGDDEYLEEFLSFFFGAPLRNAAAMVPVLGPMATRAVAGFTPQQYDDRLATAPAMSAIESSVTSPSSVYKAMFENGRASRAVKDSLYLITMITGMPVSALGRPLGYMADVAQGKTEPTGPVDAIRGTLTGVSSPDSKQ